MEEQLMRLRHQALRRYRFGEARIGGLHDRKITRRRQEDSCVFKLVEKNIQFPDIVLSEPYDHEIDFSRLVREKVSGRLRTFLGDDSEPLELQELSKPASK